MTHDLSDSRQASTSIEACGVRIDPLTLAQAVERLRDFAVQGEGRIVHLCNAYTLALARRDPGYAAILNRGDLNLPDGMPLVWLANRVAGAGIRDYERPRGCDVFLTTVDRGREWGFRHYLYGGSPEVVDRLALRLTQGFPGAEIVGAESPPYRPLTSSEEADLADRVRVSGAQFVWVGLGTPRQDELADRLRGEACSIFMSVGAAFDFISGAKPMAPRWMSSHGFEWAFRFGSEPKRLWRRYLLGNTTFVVGLLRDGVRVHGRSDLIDLTDSALGAEHTTTAENYAKAPKARTSSGIERALGELNGDQRHALP